MRFVRQVTIASALSIVALAMVAAWLAGRAAAAGVLAGGVIALGNLWWLAARAVGAESGTGAAWPVGVALRLAAVGLALAFLLANGAHPVAVVVGLTVLPCALVARGLAAAREA